jgi:hypothetical protein
MVEKYTHAMEYYATILSGILLDEVLSNHKIGNCKKKKRVLTNMHL